MKNQFPQNGSSSLDVFGGFDIRELRNHRNYTFALTHTPNRGETWSLHIIEKEQLLGSCETVSCMLSASDLYMSRYFKLKPFMELLFCMLNFLSNILSSFTGRSTNEYNPIYLYGDPVLLSRRIDAITENHTLAKGKKVIRLSSDILVSSIISGAINGSRDEANKLFRSGSMLVFENVEELAFKETTQCEFYRLFDYYYEHGKQIILSSSLPPRSLCGLEDRVRTQIESGLIFCVDEMANNDNQ